MYYMKTGISIEELHEIINKEDNLCDGYEMHIKYLFENNESKRLFKVTGLDLSKMLYVQ